VYHYTAFVIFITCICSMPTCVLL